MIFGEVEEDEDEFAVVVVVAVVVDNFVLFVGDDGDVEGLLVMVSFVR